jgi:hypothetical protein
MSWTAGVVARRGLVGSRLVDPGERATTTSPGDESASTHADQGISMLKRALGTGVALVTAAAAGLLWGCTSAPMRLLFEGSADACDRVSPLAIAPPTVWVISLGLLAAVVLSLTWVPVISRKRRHAEWDHAFVANLKRITQPVPRSARESDHFINLEASEFGPRSEAATRQTSVGLAERREEPSSTTNPLARNLARRVGVLQTLLASEGTPTREVTRAWIELLKQANDLHNNGSLPTDEFRTLNTRLLDLLDEQ